jgi:hypothetical protein
VVVDQIGGHDGRVRNGSQEGGQLQPQDDAGMLKNVECVAEIRGRTTCGADTS